MIRNKIITPLQQKRMFDAAIDGINLLIFVAKSTGMQDKVKKLQEVQKALKSLYRISVTLHAALIAELLTLVSMTIYNIIDHEGHLKPARHLKAGLVVYPSMFVVMIYIAYLMDIGEKKAKLLSRQMEKIKDKTL